MDIKQQAQIAAKWWADLLRKKNTRQNTDSPHDDLIGTLQWMLLQTQENADDSISLFERELTSIVESELTRFPRLLIDFDYGPSETLSTAMKRAGLKNMIGIPYKSCFVITPEYGYGQQGYNPIEIAWGSLEGGDK